jgi:Helix-turn-helix domain
VATFGEKLRQQREQRGITLDAISKTTKISTRLLRALEDERFDQLPGGVFNKGFVRAYARLVGLDEEEILGEYHAALRESLIQEEKILYDGKKRGAKALSALDTIERREQDRRNSDRRRQERRNRDRRSSDRDIENRATDSRIGGENRPKDDRFKDDRALDAGPTENRDNRLRKTFAPDKNQEKDRVTDFPEAVLSQNVFLNDDNSSKSTLTSAVPEAGENFLKLPADSEPAHPRNSKNQPLPNYPLADHTVREVPVIESRVENGSVSGPVRSLPVSETPAHPATESSFQISRGVIAVVVLFVVVILALWRFRHRTDSVTSPLPSATSAQTTPTSLPEPQAGPPSAESHAAAPGASSTTALAAPAAARAPKIASRPSAPPAPGPFTVVIRADKSTSITVLADGQSVAHENLIAPAATSVRASHDVIVKVANGAAISFVLNGKLIRPEATEGEAKTYVLNSNGLIGAPQGPAANP